MNILVRWGEAKYDLKIFIFGRIVIISKIWKRLWHTLIRWKGFDFIKNIDSKPKTPKPQTSSASPRNHNVRCMLLLPAYARNQRGVLFKPWNPL